MSLLRIKQADGSWENIPAIKGADGIDGKDGAIQYTAGRYIQIDEDTQTINCTVKIGDLVIIDAVPVKDSTNVVSSGGVYDALEAKADKTDIAGLGSEAGFITNSVEDLRNYYKKSETYSQEEVNSLLGNLTRLTLQVVQELPEVGTEHVIYLVPNDESGNNVFEEWIFIQSKWEMIGTTEVDLSNYYTKEEVDLLLESLSGDDSIVTVKSGTVFYPNSGYYTSLSATEYAPIQEYITKRRKQGHQSLAIQLQTNGYGSVLFISKTSVHPAQHATLILKAVTEDSGFLYGWEMKVSGSYESDEDRTYTVSGVSFKRTTLLNSAQILAKNNTTAFTPTGDYNPATKKYVDDKVLDAIPQKSEMPEASADYLDKIYQYIGEDTEEFTKGFFYQCISETVDNTVTYSWSELKFNTDNESVECVYNLTENTTSEPFKGVNVGLGNSTVPGFRAALKQSLNAGHKNFMINIRFSKTGEKLELICTIDGETISISCWKAWYIYNGSYISFYKPIKVGGISNISEIDAASAFIWLNFKSNCVSVPDSSRLITKDNTTEFTPTSDYHPATKKYVDDAVANAGAGGGSSESPDYLTDIYLIDFSENTNFNAFTLWNGRLSEVVNVFADYVNYWYNSNKLSVPLQIIGQQQYNSPILYSTMPKNNYGYNGSFIKSKPTNIYLYGFRIDDASNESNLVPKLYSVKIYGSWTDEVFTAITVDCKKLDLKYNVDLSSYAKTTDVLTKTNTTEFTPDADFHPATKKYVDDAVANAGGGSGEGADLSDYYNKEEVDAKVAPLASAADVLTKTNTTEYTPASAYHPATKQYVDQTVASSGAITEESDPTVPLHVKNITQDMITKWNNAPTDEDVTNAATEAVNGANFVRTETDPAFRASAAAGIASSDIDNWNSKADLADIDSALISTLGGTYSIELAASPIYNTTEITMTEELLELATNVKDAIAVGKPPKITLRVTFNDFTEDLHFIPRNYNVDEGYCNYIAPVYNHQDDEDSFRDYCCSILEAHLRFYYLNATNKSMSISYSDIISLSSINSANWVNGSLTEDSTPDIGLGLYSGNSNLTLATTLDLAYLSHSHRFKIWSGDNAPTTSRDKLVLGLLGNKLYIDFGYNGTYITKGVFQTFSEMMEAIKVTDESSDDYGKYILAENFLNVQDDWWPPYNLEGKYLYDDMSSYSNIINAYYDSNYDRVYLRGSQSGEIIVAKLVANNSYAYNGTINNNRYRVTLEIDPDENKALLNSTTDLGPIRGMTSKQTFECDAGNALIPKVFLDSDGYIERVSFVQVTFN